MREFFAGHLCNSIKHKDYRYVYDRKGMFCYTGLSAIQVERLKQEYGIYMASSGRVNVVGLHENNVEKVIKAILDVTQK